jgi:hypothetical protein
VTKDICEILDGGRKFGLHLILAHQHLKQLMLKDSEVYYSVLGNARTKVVFGGAYESSYDEDVHLYGTLAVEHTGEHGYPLLCEYVRQISSASPTSFWGRNLRPQRIGLLFCQLKHEIGRKSLSISFYLFVQTLGCYTVQGLPNHGREWPFCPRIK